MPSDQDRIRDVFKHIDRIKAAEYPAMVSRDDGYRLIDRPWKDMPEPSKLAMLQDQVDWSGVSNRDRAHILLGQIDPGKLTDPQRNRLIEAATREEPVIQNGERLPSPAEAESTADFAAAKEAEISRIPNGPAPLPQLEAVRQKIGWLQSMSYLREEGQVPQAASDTALPWWEDLSRTEQAAVLQANVNWDGFTEAQKEALINVALEGESASFFESVVDRPVRPLTQELIECCELDVWPGMATVVDFGIDSSSHLGALQFAIREGLVTPQELDAAMGSGAKLTEIAQRGENPYRFVTFRTSWDEMLPEPDEPPVQEKPGPTQDFSEILRAARSTPLDTRSDFQRLLDEAGERVKTTQVKDRDRGGPER